MAEPPARPFYVVYPGQVRANLQEGERTTTDPELHASLADALSVIHERLRADPLGWGEASFQLPNLGSVSCDGFHARIQVHFAVDQPLRVVYVAWFKLLPGHPLASLS